MPAKSSTPAKAATSSKSTASTKPRRAPARGGSTSAKAKTRQATPDHSAIAERAYFIHLEEGSSDEVANWLRAERELSVA